MKEHIIAENGFAFIKINPEVYSLDMIYSSAYVFLDKAYIVLDGNPKSEITVRLRPKSEMSVDSLKELGEQFFNELVNYANYHKRSAETKNLREMLLHRAIMTNDPGAVECDTCDPCDSPSEQSDDDFLSKIDEINEDYISDPEGIAVPWEDKYEKKEENNKAAEDTPMAQVQSVPEKTSTATPTEPVAPTLPRSDVSAKPAEPTEPTQVPESTEKIVAEPVTAKVQSPTEIKEQKIEDEDIKIPWDEEDEK